MFAHPSSLTTRVVSVPALVLVIALAGVVGGCAQTPAGGAATAPPSVVAAALFVHADTVLGPTNLTAAEKPTKSCVFANRFAHNEQIVWRVRVMDPATGKPLDDKGVKSLQVKFADQALDLKYGGHPKSNPVDFFWTTSWVVPAGYPTGSLPYTVLATSSDGRTGTFEQFKVPSAMVQITDDVRTPIAPTPAPSSS